MSIRQDGEMSVGRKIHQLRFGVSYYPAGIGTPKPVGPAILRFSNHQCSELFGMTYD